MNNALKATDNNNATPLTDAINRGYELQSEFIKSLSEDQRKLLGNMDEAKSDIQARWYQACTDDSITIELENECRVAVDILNFNELGNMLNIENQQN